MTAALFLNVTFCNHCRPVFFDLHWDPRLNVLLVAQVDGAAAVLEPVVGHGAQFSCVVLDTPRGPVALPPTEIAAYDLEHDVLEAHLDMERRQARFEVRAGWTTWLQPTGRPRLPPGSMLWGLHSMMRDDGLQAA